MPGIDYTKWDSLITSSDSDTDSEVDLDDPRVGFKKYKNHSKNNKIVIEILISGQYFTNFVTNLNFN